MLAHADTLLNNINLHDLQQKSFISKAVYEVLRLFLLLLAAAHKNTDTITQTTY